MRKLGLFSFLLFILPLTIEAQVRVIQVPSDAPTIQAAVDQAAAILHGPRPSDVLIEVAAGTYRPVPPGFNVSAIDSPAFTVTLRALQGPMVTTIDASNLSNNAITGTGTRSLVVDGFTVRNRIPNQDTFVGRGMFLNDASGITVQNCHFDTTEQGMLFRVTNPSLGTRVQVVNNTAETGQGDDPLALNFVPGQAVSMVTAFPFGANPTGEPRLIVAQNVFRTRGSSVRFINFVLSPEGDVLATFSNGSLEMTGNDVSSFSVGGFNIIGGHGHFIAGNRSHDGELGGLFQSAVSGVIENNLIFNNAEHGLFVSDGGGPLPTPFAGEDRIIRHNTIVQNAGTGIVYVDNRGARNFLPNVYNNIVAFNDASGMAAVQSTADVFAFIPVSFDLTNNDDFGNTLMNLGFPFLNLSYVGISNPEAAAPDYSGVINSGLDLALDPEFADPSRGDFSLQESSPMRDAGTTSRPTPFRDFAGNLRDAFPDIGAYELVAASGVSARRNSRGGASRKGSKSLDR